MKINSPFLVVENAISPARCEKLIEQFGLLVPSLDDAGQPIKNERILKDPESITTFHGLLQGLGEKMETRFGGKVTAMESPLFQQYFENPKVPARGHACENSKFLRKKWVKIKDVDLVGFLWLKDFNSGVPIDPRFETYGGKLEFPAYDFSLVPQRGTLVLYPAGPHFITAISPILIGSLEQIRLTVKLTANNGGPWFYQPENFPGTYQQWFSEDAQ